jgi:4-amino-4-deoxy-L-arabinose transferase-like glycosyltransferase
VSRPLQLFIASILILLVIAPLFSQGLFIDGLLYKTVANNYFTGEGSFWNMKFTNTSMNPFYEQPPLFFFLNGLYYKIFGNSFLADKIFTLLLIIISGLLLNDICKKLFPEQNVKHLIWLQLLAVPVFCWAYMNQVIETLVLPLSLLGFWIFLQSRITNSVLIPVLFSIAFSITVVLMFLTKGFQSCFIVIAPFVFSVLLREKKSLVFWMISSVLIAGMLYFLMKIYSPSSEWFEHYYHKRLMASLEGVGATTTYRAEIIVRVFTEFIPVFVLILIACLYSLNKIRLQNDPKKKKLAIAILIIAVSGSFPFAITLEQRGFYLVPSLPYYVIALSLFFSEQLFFLQQKVISLFGIKWISVAILILFLGAVTYWIISPFRFKRDETRILDLKLISPYLHQNDTISVDESMWNDTALQAYLYMQKKVSVEGNGSHSLFIHDREHGAGPYEKYEKVNIPTRQYDLYRKNNNPLKKCNLRP